MKANRLPEKENVRDLVRESYSKAAKQTGCCGTERPTAPAAEKLGYSADDIAALPEGADLGLGCGNPQAIASLKPGETVLDLGSGAGLDCFLASHSVGLTGRVAGAASVDELETMLRDAGFEQIRIRPKNASKEFICTWTSGGNAADYVVSSTLEAVKPATACCSPNCCS